MGPHVPQMWLRRGAGLRRDLGREGPIRSGSVNPGVCGDYAPVIMEDGPHDARAGGLLRHQQEIERTGLEVAPALRRGLTHLEVERRCDRSDLCEDRREQNDLCVVDGGNPKAAARMARIDLVEYRIKRAGLSYLHRLGACAAAVASARVTLRATIPPEAVATFRGADSRISYFSILSARRLDASAIEKSPRLLCRSSGSPEIAATNHGP